MPPDEDLCVSCPICMEKYSATRYPIVAPNCGHSLCIECGKKRKSSVCVSCLGISSRAVEGVVRAWPSDEWNKNFTLLELINLRAAEPKSTGIDFMGCFGCKTMEKRERMKICGTCAGEWNKEWEGMKEEEIRSFILCGFCCHEEHSSHEFIKYLPWKLNHLFNSTVTQGMSAVSSMDELCSHEFGHGRDQMKKWEEKVSAFRSIECSTYQGGLSTAKTLQQESDLLTQMSELCLPPLRKFRKAVTDSSARLDNFMEEIKKGNSNVGESAEAQEVAQLLAKPSEVAVLKADYEKQIVELEQKKEDEKRVMKEEMSRVCHKALTSTVHVRRLPTTRTKLGWQAGPSHVDRLYLSVSHKTYLCAVQMYRVNMESHTVTTMGVCRVFDGDTILGAVVYVVVKGSVETTTQRVNFDNGVQLTPNKQYRLELVVNQPVLVFYGEDGVNKMALPDYPDRTVSFSTHPGKSPGRKHDTSSAWGQFAGFHFRVGQ